MTWQFYGFQEAEVTSFVETATAFFEPSRVVQRSQAESHTFLENESSPKSTQRL